MNRFSKLLLIAGGYVAAFLIAWVAVYFYIVATDTPDRQLYGGMYAFGDSILFLGVLALAAIPATCVALYFLRPYPIVWRVLTAGSLAIAFTGILALLASMPVYASTLTNDAWRWAALSPIRVLVAPIFGIGALLGAIFSPARSYRLAFLSALLTEIVVFVSVVSMWTLSNR